MRYVSVHLYSIYTQAYINVSEIFSKMKLWILSKCSLWYHKYPIPFYSLSVSDQSDNLNLNDLTVFYPCEHFSHIHCVLYMTTLEKTCNGKSVLWILPVPIKITDIKYLYDSVLCHKGAWKMFNIIFNTLVKTVHNTVTSKS